MELVSHGLTGIDLQPHPIGSEDYYMDIVIQELINLTHSSSVSKYRDRLVRCYSIIVVKSGASAVSYFPKVM